MRDFILEGPFSDTEKNQTILALVDLNQAGIKDPSRIYVLGEQGFVFCDYSIGQYSSIPFPLSLFYDKNNLIEHIRRNPNRSIGFILLHERAKERLQELCITREIRIGNTIVLETNL
jgi:hypothetical protein